MKDNIEQADEVPPALLVSSGSKTASHSAEDGGNRASHSAEDLVSCKMVVISRLVSPVSPLYNSNRLLS